MIKPLLVMEKVRRQMSEVTDTPRADDVEIEMDELVSLHQQPAGIIEDGKSSHVCTHWSQAQCRLSMF